MSRAALAKAVGVTQQAVYGWEETEATPSYHRLKKIAIELNTTLEWLSAGIDVTVPISAHYILIPLLGTESDKGGNDVQHNVEVGELADDSNSFAYRRDLLEEIGVKPEWCRVFLTDDDSMNLGRQLLIDLEQNKIEDRKVYLLQTPAGYRARRLFLQIDGTVKVCADHRDIPDQLVKPDAVQVIGRVVVHQGTL